MSSISVTFDPQADEMRFETPVENAYFEASYERKKGPKVVNRVPLKGDDLKFGPNAVLFHDYDILVALDTNTQYFAGRKVSITGAAVGERAVAPDGSRAVSWHCPLCVEMIDILAQEERIGWIEGLRALYNDGLITQQQRIGLVVDSHLSDLQAINARTQAVFRNVFLPENVTLVYASSDTGGEYLANTLIRAADRSAALALAYLKAGKAPPNTEILQGMPFKGRRIIVPRPTGS